MSSQVVQCLKGELKRRQDRNPGYSIRAFAKSLELSHSFLLRVLSYERKLSIETSEKSPESIGVGEIS